GERAVLSAGSCGRSADGLRPAAPRHTAEARGTVGLRRGSDRGAGRRRDPRLHGGATVRGHGQRRVEHGAGTRRGRGGRDGLLPPCAGRRRRPGAGPRDGLAGRAAGAVRMLRRRLTGTPGTPGVPKIVTTSGKLWPQRGPETTTSGKLWRSTRSTRSTGQHRARSTRS